MLPQRKDLRSVAIKCRCCSLSIGKARITKFKNWLGKNDAYVFTINGFPYGNFHGSRVKEQVYRPDWSTQQRLNYTLVLFSILEELLEPGEEGSVSTLPGSFKEFHPKNEIPEIMLENLSTCALEIDRLAAAKNLDLHLGMEPEPLGMFETTPETISFLKCYLVGVIMKKYAKENGVITIAATWQLNLKMLMKG